MIAQHAGIGRRVSSFIIDFVLIWSLVLIWAQFARFFLEMINIHYYPKLTFMGQYKRDEWNFFVVFIAELALWYSAYFLACMIIFRQTLGQKTLRIKWVLEDSNPIENKQILKRWVIGLFKIGIVVAPGPGIAAIFPSFNSWSMFMLLVALMFLILEPLISFQKIQRSLSEKYSGLFLVQQ